MSELSRATRDLLKRGRLASSMGSRHRARLKETILLKATGVSVVTTAATASAWTSVGAKAVGAVALVTMAGLGVAAGTGVLPRALIGSARDAPAEGPRAGGEIAKGAPLVRPGAESAPSFASAPPSAPEAPASKPALPTGDSSNLPVPAAPPSAPTQAVLPPKEPRVRAPEPVDTLWIPSAPFAGREGFATGAASEAPLQAAPVASAPLPVVSSTPQPPALASDIEQQVTLLRDAERALNGGDAVRALALLDEHAARFPSSVLEPERRAERVFALCRAGRAAQARAEATGFLRAHPSGALAERVRTSCGGS